MGRIIIVVPDYGSIDLYLYFSGRKHHVIAIPYDFNLFRFALP